MAQMHEGLSNKQTWHSMLPLRTWPCPTPLHTTSTTLVTLSFLWTSNTFLLQGLPTCCPLCLRCFSSTHPLGSHPPHFIPVSAHLNLTKVFPAHSYWNSTFSFSRLLPGFIYFFLRNTYNSLILYPLFIVYCRSPHYNTSTVEAELTLPSYLQCVEPELVQRGAQEIFVKWMNELY